MSKIQSRVELQALRKAAHVFVEDSFLGIQTTGNACFDALLWQVVLTYKMSIQRSLDNTPADEKWFERVVVNNLLCSYLAVQIADHADAQHKIEKQLTKAERRAVKYLSLAMSSFTVTEDELSAQFPTPDLTGGHGLAERFWFAFTELDKSEAIYAASFVQAWKGAA